MDWLKTILTVNDRRAKILLVKSLSQARLATVMVEGASTNWTYSDVLLPKGLTPLEIAFITDPQLGISCTGIFLRDLSRELTEPIREGIGLIKFRSGDVQYRDYARHLKDPLARLKYVNRLKEMGRERRDDLLRQILRRELEKIHLPLEDLVRSEPEKVTKLLERMAGLEITAEEAGREIKESIKRVGGDVISLETLDLLLRQVEPEELIGTVLWLLSDSSRFVHGTVIPIDGGFSAFSGV
jgi:(p)ppGpp synthase/HD superfamily hydrolase